MYISTTGLVLREVRYKESSKMLTVLTDSMGKVPVSARGALRKGSKIGAAAQFLTFSEMTLSGTNGRWTMTEGRVLEEFRGLREDLMLLSLGTYFAELAELVSDEDVPDPELMQLLLNTLFALSEGLRSPELIKAAFELRLMCAAGFAPVTNSCPVCGKEDMARPVLDLAGGAVRCGGCGAGLSAPLCEGSLAAMRYIVTAPPRKLFSFQLGKEALFRLTEACERYVMTQLGCELRSLAFYKSMRKQ
ncbi:MAG: DNA repair protein RecO [Oscillospiraceae bacterium]|nr:DNA repair protein RecO [Oscillospiraceae bacterium]